jgi:hypothetical protein
MCPPSHHSPHSQLKKRFECWRCFIESHLQVSSEQLMADPNFLRNMLSGLPGVNADDEEIQKALRDLVEVCWLQSSV